MDCPRFATAGLASPVGLVLPGAEPGWPVVPGTAARLATAEAEPWLLGPRQIQQPAPLDQSAPRRWWMDERILAKSDDTKSGFICGELWDRQCHFVHFWPGLRLPTAEQDLDRLSIIFHE